MRHRTTTNSSLSARALAALSTLIAMLLALWSSSPAMAFTNDTYFTKDCKGSSGCSFQWGLDRVGAEYAWPVNEGSGVLIGIIDSGVDPDHPDLKSQLMQGADFVGGDSNPTDNDPRDENGHGTIVAGIAAASTGNGVGIASVAPKARLLPVRVFGPDGTATTADVREGINYAVDRARSLDMSLVLNLSFETSEEEGKPDPLALLLSSPEVDQAIQEAAKSGATVVIAAGNEGRSRTSYDAPDGSGVVVVGASDQNDNRLSLSNYGPGLDLIAPGIDITSTYWHAERGSSYAVAGGTSMSVPFVVGGAAMLMSNGMSNVQSITQLLDTARDIGDPGRDDQTGHGLLDIAAAMGVQRPGVTKPSVKPPAPKASPSPSPSPSPFVLPSPGSPPPLVQPASNPSPGPATGTVASSEPDEQGPIRPLKPLAASLVGIVFLMHTVRRLFLV